MNYLRISKYNPNYRNKLGHYCKDEWTEYNQINKYFDSPKKAYREYLKIEEKYISTIELFIRFYDCSEIYITNKEFKSRLELQSKESARFLDVYDKLRKIKKVKIEELSDIIALTLRGYFWSVLTNDTNSIKVEFGYDFYIYLYSDKFHPDLIKGIEKIGLFIE